MCRQHRAYLQVSQPVTEVGVALQDLQHGAAAGRPRGLLEGHRAQGRAGQRRGRWAGRRWRAGRRGWQRRGRLHWCMHIRRLSSQSRVMFGLQGTCKLVLCPWLMLWHRASARVIHTRRPCDSFYFMAPQSLVVFYAGVWWQ